MPSFKTLPDIHAVAQAAAELTVRELTQALHNHGSAIWVLAGGTSPSVAYAELAKNYHKSLPWQKVQVLMGDERCVSHDNPDSNWGQVQKHLQALQIPKTNQIAPNDALSPKEAANQYEQALSKLPQTQKALPRLDHVWLGIGEDGHTLSLFPGHEATWDADRLVIAVHDSPKPPPDRISLTLRALSGTKSCLVFAVGQNKAGVVRRAQQNDKSLPIVQATNAIESAGGHVTWLVDQEANAG